jgi:hypothetical protein
MKTECAECQAIALEMKAALLEIQHNPDPTLVTTDVRQRLRNLYSSEEFIRELSDSARNSRMERAYRRWTKHRIVTGHTGVELPFWN